MDCWIIYFKDLDLQPQVFISKDYAETFYKANPGVCTIQAGILADIEPAGTGPDTEDNFFQTEFDPG